MSTMHSLVLICTHLCSYLSYMQYLLIYIIKYILPIRIILLLNPKMHTRASDSTKHITLRIPDYVMAALDSDAARLGVSVNSVTNIGVGA